MCTPMLSIRLQYSTSHHCLIVIGMSLLLSRCPHVPHMHIDIFASNYYQTVSKALYVLSYKDNFMYWHQCRLQVFKAISYLQSTIVWCILTMLYCELYGGISHLHDTKYDSQLPHKYTFTFHG